MISCLTYRYSLGLLLCRAAVLGTQVGGYGVGDVQMCEQRGRAMHQDGGRGRNHRFIIDPGRLARHWGSERRSALYREA